VENAAMILDILRDVIINTLKQKETVGETRDGMDISLINLDPKTGKIDFSGTNNPLYLMRDGQLIIIPRESMAIVIHFTTFTPLTNRIPETMKGDHYCLLSDGNV
jgi:hypothetical protein